MKIKEVFEKHSLMIQQTPFTCAPVSLLNILHNKNQNLYCEEDLAKLCMTTTTGTVNQNLVNAAKEVGLEVIEELQGADIKDIEYHLNKKHFVIVNYIQAFSGEGHYAVVCESDESAIYLRDSSLGFVRIKKKDFVKFWYNHDKTIQGWLLAVK